ncbi:Gfo/Idh/MocA family protein [Planctomicrobium piriforme]|uniref:Predicted dehydrogenase n=1 Tax=Planctomicrobium piriforme TaxID=1576369 RepID=A0A1I3C4J0_9PLAN|nr:Gfo/Idh/MocA family oxidoreductase [Planctomicrobium piriforme]SFH69246.1 Predicted dehydrogenase [Planctomicrobium piriforme]
MSQASVRLGVVGLGGWGQNVLRSFSRTPGCELAMICDADANRLAQHGKQHPGAVATSSYQQLLQDESVQAVAIATPAPMHYAMARDALLAGKHVYVEKPMTLRVDHAEELVRLAATYDRKLMVGHLLMYHPAVQYLRQQITAGSLGDIYYIYCQRLNLGVVRSDENAFWSLAPHDISIIQYLFGAEPEQIVASGQSYLQPGVEDVVFANMRFNDGRIANIHVSWLDPLKTRQIVVVGSKKMVVFDDMQVAEKIRVYDKGAAREMAVADAMGAVKVRHGDIVIPHLPSREPLLEETSHFIDCVQNNKQPLSDGRNGLQVVRVLETVEQNLKAQRHRLQRAA